ncbi:hypothetical protein [Nocardiopsis oceani]
MSLITVIGMLGGLAVVLVARRGKKAMEKLIADELAGRAGPREIAQARVEQKRRSVLLVQAICGFVAVLLVAVLGRAAVSGDWGGMTTYYAAIFGVVLVVSGIALRQVGKDLTRAREKLDQLNS